jgi:(p)ppGpp synthase/HD superfamily hydrolase
MELALTPAQLHAKHKNTLYWQLHGLKMYRALDAFHFVETRMAGSFRKDGVTPSFFHQVSQCLRAFTLRKVIDFEGLICTILLHDDLEDYDTDFDWFKMKFGQDIYDSVWPMSKTYMGFVKDPQQVFWEIGNNHNSSLAKMLDRADNFSTMNGVFSPAKQVEYIDEGVHLFLPMSKRARKKFPQQIYAHIGVEGFLKSQIQLLKIINNITN